MKRWHKVSLGLAAVAVGLAVMWLVTTDSKGRAMRDDAAAKLSGKNKNRGPTFRAIGRNGTTLELSTKGLGACHKEELGKSMEALQEPSAGSQGIASLKDPARVYVVTPEGDVSTASRDEVASVLRRGFSLASRERVAEEKATAACGDPNAKCSPSWLTEMAASYATGESGQMMAALGFAQIACVGDDWEGEMPLKR